jgi:hypothetical protein
MPPDDARTPSFDPEQLFWLARVLGIVIRPPPKPRLPAAKSVLGSTQRSRADALLAKLPEADRERFETITKHAKSNEERDYVTKALAANHSVKEIAAFAKKIRGKNAKWMQNHLKLTGNTHGKGVKQQWHDSCNATTVQAVQAELDPIYALKLHAENANVTKARDSGPTKGNRKLAAEQKAMLETPYAGKVAGAAGIAGKAVARDQGGGAGRWADDLLNARSATTGLTYTTKLLGGAYTLDKATRELDQALTKGQPVPIVIGDGGANANAHYVLVTQMDEGPPKEYTIHDPWDGITVTRSANDLAQGKVNLAGWNQVSAMEIPAEVK